MLHADVTCRHVRAIRQCQTVAAMADEMAEAYSSGPTVAIDCGALQAGLSRRFAFNSLHSEVLQLATTVEIYASLAPACGRDSTEYEDAVLFSRLYAYEVTAPVMIAATKMAFTKRANTVTEVRLQQLSFEASEPILKDYGIILQSIIWDSTKTLAVLTLTLLSPSVDAVGTTTPLDNEQRYLSEYHDFCMSQPVELVVAADHASSGDVIHRSEDSSRRLKALMTALHLPLSLKEQGIAVQLASSVSSHAAIAPSDPTDPAYSPQQYQPYSPQPYAGCTPPHY